jgi:hypothetical protein
VTCIVNEQARVTAEQFERSVHWRAEFLQWFALEICRYNNSIHSSLGCSPVAKWEELAGEMSGDIPFDMEAFRVSFLPSEQRQVRRDGIHPFDLRYWSDALAGYVGRRDGKVVVRYDPRDLSAVWVELDGGRCVEARYRNLEIPPVSLWEYREAILAAVGAPSSALSLRAQSVASLEVRVVGLLRDLGLRMIMIDEVHNLLAGRRLCSALASMGTQELPCFMRSKRSPGFLQQLTRSYCETGKDSHQLAPKYHV